MKITSRFIDEKGRLFGKINIIDAMILVLVVAFIVIWAGLIKKTISTEHIYDRQRMIVELEVKDIPHKLYKLIKEGDVDELKGLGFRGIVKKVEKTTYREKNFEGEIREYNDARVRLELMVHIKETYLSYKTQELRPGKKFTFITPRYLISGTVIAMEKVECK